MFNNESIILYNDKWISDGYCFFQYKKLKEAPFDKILVYESDDNIRIFPKEYVTTFNEMSCIRFDNGSLIQRKYLDAMNLDVDDSVQYYYNKERRIIFTYDESELLGGIMEVDVK